MAWRKKIKQQAAKDIGVALEQLLALFSNDSEDFNNCILFQSEFIRLKKNRLLDTDSPENLNRIENSLLRRIMAFVDDLNINPTSLSSTSDNKGIDIFYENIVVYCTSDRKEYMQQFFNNYYFKNIFFFNIGEKLEKDCDLIVFDDKEPTPISESFLKELLDTNQFVIYFGGRFPLSILDYNDRVYFANSIFSLYARIKEMIDFLKYIKPK